MTTEDLSKKDATDSVVAAPRKRKYDSRNLAQNLPKRTGKALSKAVIKQSLVLNSTHTQQIYDRSFEYVENSLYSISVILRIIASPQDAMAVHNQIDRIFTETIGSLRSASVKLDVMATSNGIEFGDIQYTNPVTFEPPISSPKAVRFLAVLRELDQVIMKFDTCWMSGLLSDDEYGNQVFALKKIVLRASSEISKLNSRAKKAPVIKKEAQSTEDAPAITDAIGSETVVAEVS